MAPFGDTKTVTGNSVKGGTIGVTGA